MTGEDLKLLQRTQVSLMKLVHNFCVQNSIRYYIIGGTALGAVRHGGFIPWDIDMDIAMPRADYERFKELCKTQLDERLTYHDYSNTKNIFVPHGVVCIKDTVLKEAMVTVNKRDIQQVFLDIFPLDDAPADPKLQEKQAKKIRASRAFKAHKVGVIYRGSKKEWIVKRFIHLLMTPFSFKGIGKRREKIMRKYDGCDSGLVCSMTSHYSYKKQLMPFEIYGEPTPVKFEDAEFFAPQKLEEYLTRLFGDYMQLPPEEKRTALLNHFTEVYVPEEIQKGMF